MRAHLIPTLALPLALAGACASAAPPPPAPAETKAFTMSSNAFGAELYRALSASPGNIFVSPASISTAFAMTYAGAGGDTAAAMAKTLHFGPQTPAFHEDAGAELKALQLKGEGRQLTVANAIWVDAKLPLKGAFEKVNAVEYGAAVKRVNFAAAPASAVNKINTWVSDQTAHKITALFAPGDVTADTKLVLTNTVYMKADWAAPFRAGATQDGPFAVSPGKTVTAAMMRRTGHYTYAKGEGFQLLSMPFKGGELAFVIALPDSADGLGALEQKLDAGALAAWRGQLTRSENVDLQIPRMKLALKYDLVPPLTRLGLGAAFSDQADFSGVTDATGLKIDKAVHQTYLMVDETGAEAAAATGLGMVATAAPIFQPPIPFHADHPFLFWIEDTRSGAALFIGRMTDPSA
jgi:serpin B